MRHCARRRRSPPTQSRVMPAFTRKSGLPSMPARTGDNRSGSKNQRLDQRFRIRRSGFVGAAR